jgi:hypothetical protein
MGRPYKPVELPLKTVPEDVLSHVDPVRCPSCETPVNRVLGRLGLRLVFRCESCRVRF